MLFGHQNDDSNANNQVAASAVDSVAGIPAPDPLAVNATGVATISSLPTELDAADAPTASALDQPTSAPSLASPTVAPVNAAVPTQSDDILTTTSNDELLQLKQQALQQLSPLVGHLEQSPEEKFRTTMMMIQSSDNQALIKDAYAAAQAIVDDKARAQALLDIVNEINYFTQQAPAS